MRLRVIFDTMASPTSDTNALSPAHASDELDDNEYTPTYKEAFPDLLSQPMLSRAIANNSPQISEGAVTTASTTKKKKRRHKSDLAAVSLTPVTPSRKTIIINVPAKERRLLYTLEDAFAYDPTSAGCRNKAAKVTELETAACVKIRGETGVEIEAEIVSFVNTLRLLLTGRERSIEKARALVMKRLITQVSVSVFIPKHQHCMITGKDGDRISKLQQRGSVKVVAPDTSDKSRDIQIIGMRDAVEQVQREILAVSQKQPGENAECSDASPLVAVDEKTRHRAIVERLDIPNAYHAFVRGAHGCNLGTLKLHWPGVNVVIRDSTYDEGEHNVVTVVGDNAQDVQSVKNEIELVYKNAQQNFVRMDNVKLTVNEYMRVVVAEKQLLEQILAQTGVSVILPSAANAAKQLNSDSTDSTFAVALIGNIDRLQDAIAMLRRAKAEVDEAAVTRYVDCPAWLQPRLIGRNEQQNLREQYPQVQVHVDTEDVEKVCVHGPAEQVESLSQELKKLVGELLRTLRYQDIVVRSAENEQDVRRLLMAGDIAQRVKRLRETYDVQIHIPPLLKPDDFVVIRVEGAVNDVDEVAKQLSVIVYEAENPPIPGQYDVDFRDAESIPSVRAPPMCHYSSGGGLARPWTDFVAGDDDRAATFSAVNVNNPRFGNANAFYCRQFPAFQPPGGVPFQPQQFPIAQPAFGPNFYNFRMQANNAFIQNHTQGMLMNFASANHHVVEQFRQQLFQQQQLQQNSFDYPPPPVFRASSFCTSLVPPPSTIANSTTRNLPHARPPTATSHDIKPTPGFQAGAQKTANSVSGKVRALTISSAGSIAISPMSEDETKVPVLEVHNNNAGEAAKCLVEPATQSVALTTPVKIMKRPSQQLKNVTSQQKSPSVSPESVNFIAADSSCHEKAAKTFSSPSLKKQARKTPASSPAATSSSSSKPEASASSGVALLRHNLSTGRAPKTTAAEPRYKRVATPPPTIEPALQRNTTRNSAAQQLKQILLSNRIANDKNDKTLTAGTSCAPVVSPRSESVVSSSADGSKAADRNQRNSGGKLSFSLAVSNVSDSIDIPHQLHHLVIGKNGEKIKKIQHDCGDKLTIRFPDPPKNPLNASDTVCINGPASQVAEAKRRLLEAAENTGMYIRRLRVQPPVHPMIVGVGGANVQRLRNTYNVSINIPNVQQVVARAKNFDTVEIIGAELSKVNEVCAIIETIAADWNDMVEERVRVPLKFQPFLTRNHANGSLYIETGDDKLGKEQLQQISRALILNSTERAQRMYIPPTAAESANVGADTLFVSGSPFAVEFIKKRIIFLQNCVWNKFVTTNVSVPADVRRRLNRRKSSLCEQFDVTITDVKQSTNAGEAQQIEIFGASDSVELAKVAILSMKNESNSLLTTRVTRTLSVPCQYHWKIVGTQGSLRKRLSAAHNVNIIIPPSSAMNETIRIQGAPANVSAATAAVEKIWRDAEQLASSENRTIVMTIPFRMHGRIIGPRGDVINELRQKHQVEITFVDNTKSDPKTTTMTILGETEAEAKAARVSIEDIIKEFSCKFELEIDRRVRNRFVGVGGETARRVERKYNVHVDIVQLHLTTSNSDPTRAKIFVMGKEADCIACMQELDRMEEVYLEELYANAAKQRRGSGTGADVDEQGGAGDASQQQQARPLRKPKTGLRVRDGPWEEVNKSAGKQK